MGIEDLKALMSYSQDFIKFHYGHMEYVSKKTLIRLLLDLEGISEESDKYSIIFRKLNRTSKKGIMGLIEQKLFEISFEKIKFKIISIRQRIISNDGNSVIYVNNVFSDIMLDAANKNISKEKVISILNDHNLGSLISLEFINYFYNYNEYLPFPIQFSGLSHVNDLKALLKRDYSNIYPFTKDISLEFSIKNLKMVLSFY